MPPDNKKILKRLQEEKKWFPYNIRHSSLSRLKNNPNVNDYTLRQQAGWSKNSRMAERYTHDLETDSFEHVMLAYGVDVRAAVTEEEKQRHERLQQELQGEYCRYCGMTNDKGARFCSSCKVPLLPEAAIEQREEADRTKKELEEIRSRQERKEKDFEEMKRKLDLLFKVVESKDLLLDFHEDQKKMLLRSPELRKAAREVQREQEDIDRLEQEAAKVVDSEMETEMFSPSPSSPSSTVEVAAAAAEGKKKNKERKKQT